MELFERRWSGVSAAATALALLMLVVSSCSRTARGPRAAGGPVRFFRERVIVRPSDGQVRVLGHYHFRNASSDSVELAIRYPFPVDAHHSRPAGVDVARIEEDGASPVGFRARDDHISWRMSFEPGEEKLIAVRYRQRIARKHAVYIVTTTSAWGDPIELAEFEFRVPRSLDNVRLSFEPDSVAVRADSVVYYAEWSDFMPRSDLEVWWE